MIQLITNHLTHPHPNNEAKALEHSQLLGRGGDRRAKNLRDVGNANVVIPHQYLKNLESSGVAKRLKRKREPRASSTKCGLNIRQLFFGEHNVEVIKQLLHKYTEGAS